MTFAPPPPPPSQPGPGLGQGAGRARRFGPLSRGLMAGGLVMGLGLGAYGVAAAASSGSSSPSSSSSSSGTSTKPAPAAPGPKLPFRFGGGIAGIAGPGRVVHGSFTEKTSAGKYVTVEVQSGTVQDVSTSSITVKSSDGYTQTYAVTSDTIVDAQRDGISSVAKGDTVELSAQTVNGTDTAMSIADSTKIGSSRQGFGFGPMAKRATTGTGTGTTGFGPAVPGGFPAPGAPSVAG